MSKYHHRASPIQTSPLFSRPHKMPSTRRLKVYGLLLMVCIITILFYTSSARQAQSPDLRTDFYSKTKSALDKKPGTPGAKNTIVNAGSGNDLGGDEESKAMQQRLKEAADSAKEKANAKAPKPDPPSVVVGVGSAAEGASGERNVAGRKKYGAGGEAQEPVREETEEEHDAEVELNSILKKAPIIIFSKSYCPHSKRAKNILLGKYIIDPPPFVVELDQHPYGLQLQALLADKTGRRTVPNVLINGVSIGGGDDVADLDAKKTLIDKINEFSGKKILELREKPVEPIEDHGLR